MPPGLDLDEAVRRAHTAYAAARPRSRALHERALGVLAGGNTRSVLDFPPFPFRVARAHGAELVDVDGHAYVDFCGNYTAGLLGHAPAAVREAVAEALDGGWGVGAMHPREIELAELIGARFPAMARVRFTNSGTEANLMAVATALHHTGRTGVGVFDGGYHGGVLSFGHGPSSVTVPHRFVVAPFDDPAGLDTLFADPDLGCVLVEAVQGSGGCRVASPEWLRELRRRCTTSGAVLVLDEVMTSRLSPGGAQLRYGVTPDLTTLGKYLGGGMPFGAFGGREEIMRHFDRSAGGRLAHAGTFNNNAVSMAAAIATLRHALDDEALEAVNARGDRLRTALSAAFAAAGAPMHVTGLGSMLTVHAADDRLAELYFHAMLAGGHHLARRGFVALSFAVSDAHVDGLVTATRRWADGLSAAGRG
ncbi:MAG: aspartate aminotransferase family protein [Kineosporiaceae bacterium]